ncbi:SH3 and multiple ankyrin repeat domains protein 2-like [Montipora foliosa]|uniref:SH3 and multiple ankyrin repeat domains protein 2-like n=1 Tax=Montipora foliosa TaxID=591990 RepID=UPI0035F1AE56
MVKGQSLNVNNFIMKDNSRIECNSSVEEKHGSLEVLVTLPDGKVNKLYRFKVHEKVWNAKLQVMNELKGVKDIMNYGFYDPPCNGKSGKFLDEERPLNEYPLKGSPPVLEFKYKGRVYRSLMYEPKSLQKVNSKANQRKFLEMVLSNAVGQVSKLTEKGIDPNFHDDKNGETPLSLAVTRENASDTIIALVNGGALLDYRTREGLTPVHKAALAGQAESIKTLLDFGASPNYRDSKGFTPLFYTVLYGGDPYCCEILLNDHSELHVSDHQGKQEIHLACKNGLVQHLEHLLFYGAEIDSRTASGNTALHVAALNNQEECARVLLFRGAKKNILNFANQSAYEVAAVSGNKGLAELINNFTDKDIVKLSGKPAYSTRRRKSVSKPKASSLFPRTSSETQLSVNSDTTPPSLVSSTQSIPSTTASETASIEEYNAAMNGEVEIHKYSEIRRSRTLSASSTASESSNFSADSDSGELSPREERRKHRTWRQFSVSSETSESSAVPPVKAVSGAATIRKRLYASVPGKRFVVVKDYRPCTAGELALKTGDEVEVLYVGEKGFWEGRVGNSTGWFHHSCVEEKKKGKQRPKTLFGRPPSVSSFTKSDAARIVTLQRNSAGFGFQMRGANSQVPRLNFEPTPEFPALQYFGNVEEGGQAESKGVKAGDFILEVNGEDVTTATHGHVVDLIKKSGNSVTLKVITAKSKKPSVNGTDHTDGRVQTPFKLPPPPPDRDPSTTLTLGRMTRLSSSRPSLFEVSMSDGSYEEPASYGVDSVIAVSKENRWHSLQRQKPHARKPVGVQMRGQTLSNRKSHSEVNSVNAAGHRSKSMQNILPPPYESAFSRRPVSVAVPVATPHVPSDPRFLRSVSEDTGTLSRYALSSKSTPNLDKAKGEDFQNGLGSPPNNAKRSIHNRPFSYVAPGSFLVSTNEVEEVDVSPADATVVAAESSKSKCENTIVASPVEVVEVKAEVTATAPCSEKPAVPPKPRTLSDALQEAVAARTERINQRPSETGNDYVQKSRKCSAPESNLASSFQRSDSKDTKMISPTKVNQRKKFEASDLVRSQILTSLEENFTEVEVEGEKPPVKVNGNAQFDFDSQKPENCRGDAQQTIPSPLKKEEKPAVSSNEIYRHYVNATSATRDLNRQFSLDSSEIALNKNVATSSKLERQSSEPVKFDCNQNAVVESKPIQSSASSPLRPLQNQLSDRDKSSKGAVPPPPPPVVLSHALKKDTPAPPVSNGFITADALASKKAKLKSALKHETDGSKANATVGKHTESGSADLGNFAVQHNDQLAKAIAARAARISNQASSDTTLSAVSPSSQQDKETGKETQPSSPVKDSKKSLVGRASSITPCGKPSPPPVAPKKRYSSPDLRNKRYGSHAERALPFDIPAPVLSEEDKSVMMLDEVLRREAESENWSLNSWNSGSDSSSEVFLPPPVFSSENHNIDTAASRHDCGSPREEKVPKTPEPEKFNKTITTKKGFKIQLTFETKKESAKPAVTSPSSAYNDIEPVPLKPTSIDSVARTDSFVQASVKNEGIFKEKVKDESKSSLAKDTANEHVGLPPPPLLFTDNDEPYPPVDSPPLPPPPEFSPREPNTSAVICRDVEEDSASLPSSARSDDSHKGTLTYNDITSIFGGYARPMEAFLEKPVLDWDCDDVCNWLDSIKMSQYKDTFRENDIQGAHLPDLSKTELKELGVKSLGHRMTLENAIAKLSQPLESNC